MNRLNGDKNNRGFNGSAWLLMTLLALFGLQACQDGVSNDPQQETTVTSSTYSGPAARTSDIQGFRVSVWEPLRAQNRCGACHNAGGQAPLFVREDDVNQAYEAVNPFINRSEPDESSL
ncbi:MAG: hypothetical protein AB2613_04805, partial [Candidatus Thiodiazotropha taylori]